MPKGRIPIHGMSKSPEYSCWLAMRKRCYYPKTNDYAIYGGAGIKVCEAWRTSFETFFKDMGPRPSLKYSIDRLDSTKDYEPNNCRWATAKEQAESRSLMHPPKALKNCVCIVCDKFFKRSEYDVKRNRGLFCGNSCSQTFLKRTRDKAQGKATLIVPCQNCNKPIKRTTYMLNHRKTISCSFKCRSQLQKKVAATGNPPAEKFDISRSLLD